MNKSLLDYEFKDYENTFKEVPVCPYCESKDVFNVSKNKKCCNNCIKSFEWKK